MKNTNLNSSFELNEVSDATIASKTSHKKSTHKPKKINKLNNVDLQMKPKKVNEKSQLKRASNHMSKTLERALISISSISALTGIIAIGLSAWVLQVRT